MTGIESEHKFSDYPDFVEDWVFEWNVSVLGRAGTPDPDTNYGKRKLSEKSIGRDLEAYKELCSDSELTMFDHHLNSLGYK